MEELNKTDITADLVIDGDFTEEEEETASGGAEMGDHPLLALIDIGIKTSEGYLKGEGLPGPNTALYDGFSRPFLNTALWHYMPDGEIPDDPRIALALGVGGLALAFTPTLIAVKDRAEKEKRREKEKEKEKEKARAAAALEEEEHREIGPLPTWAARLDGMSVPGI